MSNKLILSGRLVRDLNIRQVGKGRVVNFTVANNREYKQRNGGEEVTKQDTLFMECDAWNKLADQMVDNNAGKGSLVEVVGYLRPNEWTNKNGDTVKSIRLTAQEVTFLDNAPKQVNAPTEKDFESVESGEATPF